MGADTITLVSPVPVAQRDTDAGPAAEDRGTLTILGFLSNRKPNTDVLHRGLIDHVEAAFAGVEIRSYEKANPGAGADQALLDKIARDCHAAVNATGD